MQERIGDFKHASGSHGSIAEILLNSGDIEEAEAHARTYLTMTEQVGNPGGIAGAHELLASIAMCQSRCEEAICHYQKNLEGLQSIARPYLISRAYIQLGEAYLRKGDYGRAIRYFEKANLPGHLTGVLGGLEEAYAALGTWEVFVDFCHSLREQHTDWMKRKSFHQWYLEPAEPSEEFPRLAFADDFDRPAATQSKESETEIIDPSWSWLDEFGDCAYRIVPAGGLEICAANGRELDGTNLSAPRFVREISGDFAVEVCMSPASDEKPQIGGLVVWKDRDNFLRFEKGIRGVREVFLDGYIDREWQFFAGRGLLPEDSRGEVHLRLERVGDEFSAYCSVDGENWLTCGTMTLPMDDPIQVGIHAIGMIDRTIYCGAYKEGTATVFRKFRIWTK
jgi:regulation of enolase protein 1 (concanavalin A-like superfamily)